MVTGLMDPSVRRPGSSVVKVCLTERPPRLDVSAFFGIHPTWNEFFGDRGLVCVNNIA